MVVGRHLLCLLMLLDLMRQRRGCAIDFVFPNTGCILYTCNYTNYFLYRMSYVGDGDSRVGANRRSDLSSRYSIPTQKPNAASAPLHLALNCTTTPKGKNEENSQSPRTSSPTRHPSRIIAIRPISQRRRKRLRPTPTRIIDDHESQLCASERDLVG